MQANEVNMTSLLLDCVEEGAHPVEVPDDSGAAKLYAFLCPRINFPHIELRSTVGIHVGLAFDVRLVESHKVFRWFLVHFGDALIPQVSMGETPEHGHVFVLVRHLWNRTVLPICGGMLSTSCCIET